MTYTKQTLQQDLAAMGLTGTETILIHSSMKSIGAVEGGADTVLDALMEFFAEGLLLLPTHTWRFINEENQMFDVRRSPCCVGILPELFRQRPGVVRSLHPTHSMAAYGKDAAGAQQNIWQGNWKTTPPAPPVAATTVYGRSAERSCCWASAMPGTPSFTAWRRC